METELTKQDILDLFEKQSELFDDRLKRSQLDFDQRLKRSQLDFDKRLGQLAGTWGKFVTEMVKPKIVELFKEKGIEIETIVQSVEGHKDGKKYYEIDLLLINSDVAVVVEVKSSLSVEDVIEHLERLEKIQKVSPKRIDLSGVTVYGAVAGMIVEQDADRFAYKKGLYVLRQKGNIVEIVNDPSFKPKEWKVEY
jgi:PII-like signaling protein